MKGWRTLSQSVAIGAVIAMAGCTTTLTPYGRSVALLDAGDVSSNCRSLGIVSASESMGSSTAGDAESAFNKLKNKAEAGANAISLISSDSSPLATTVVAEAFSCGTRRDFNAPERRLAQIDLQRISVGDSKSEVEGALASPANVVGAKQFESGIVEVWSYRRWADDGALQTSGRPLGRKPD